MAKIEELFEKGNVEEALKSASIEDLEFLIERGISSLEIGDDTSLEIAENIFKKVIGIDGKNLDAHNNLGIVFFKEGKNIESESEYKTAIKLGMEDSDFSYRKGDKLQNKGKYEEASKSYQNAIEVLSKIADFHYNLGILLHKEKQNKEGEHEYKQAIRTYVNYAEAAMKIGKKENLKLLSINQRLSDAHYNLGLLFHQQKKYKDAEKEYRKAIDIIVDYAKKLTEMNLKDEKKEEKIFSADIRLLDAHYNLALLLHEQKKFNEAEKEYKKVIELDPRYEDAHYNLGVLFQQEGKKEKARFKYKEVLRINPSHKLAKINLDIIEKKEKVNL